MCGNILVSRTRLRKLFQLFMSGFSVCIKKIFVRDESPACLICFKHTWCIKYIIWMISLFQLKEYALLMGAFASKASHYYSSVRSRTPGPTRQIGNSWFIFLTKQQLVSNISKTYIIYLYLHISLNVFHY